VAGGRVPTVPAFALAVPLVPPDGIGPKSLLASTLAWSWGYSMTPQAAAPNSPKRTTTSHGDRAIREGARPYVRFGVETDMD
jgi:hypothetical protein